MAGNPFEVELLTQEYSSTLDLLLQQEVSKLRSLIAGGTHVGKAASPVQYVGAVEFRQPEGRFSPIQFQHPNYIRRWVFPTDRDCGVPVDTWDMLRTIVDPRAQLNRVVVAAANRFFDDLIVNAAFATAKTGVDASGLTDETWPATAFVVPVDFGSSAASPLTYDKFVEAKRIFRHWENDVDAMMPIAIVGSQQESDLLKQQEVISRDYNDKPVVSSGRITSLAGVHLVFSERVPWVSNVRSCIFAMPDGLYLGIWKDMELNVTKRTDLSGQPWQLYAMLSAGATRLQLGKVVEVKCADTTGLPITPGVYA